MKVKRKKCWWCGKRRVASKFPHGNMFARVFDMKRRGGIGAYLHLNVKIETQSHLMMPVCTQCLEWVTARMLKGVQ